MANPSVTKLSKMLVEFGAATAPFTARAIGKAPMATGYSIGNETYGKDSRVYLYCPDLETRTKLEYFLFGKGCEVGRDYSPGYNVTEVRVSYFKGNNWDE